MTPETEAAVRVAVDTLVAALVAAVQAEATPPRSEPDRLIDIRFASEILGVSRSTLYQEIGSGRCRSVKVGRRRFVPSSAIAEYAKRGADS